MTGLLQTEAAARFTCLGDACEDTCCKGWGMQLTRDTVELYRAKAPELMESVTSGEAEYILKRDAKTDHCVQFVDGWCGIHKKYGTEFLGDACHFFPRSVRALGDTRLMNLALSCPEAARLMLFEPQGLAYRDGAVTRLPYSLKDFLPEGLVPEQALAIHQLFTDELESDAYSAERHMARLSTVARGLEMQPVEKWPDAVAFYFRMAEGRLPVAEAAAADYFNLINALQGLIGASKATERPRLMAVMARMAQMLGVTLNWENLTIALAADAPERVLKVLSDWKRVEADYQPVLRRYLQAQLRLHLFPFAGLGNTLSERVTIIGVRFATVRLALMCAAAGAEAPLAEADVVRIIQPISRFIDHLADPALSLAIYTETGWVREARLRALVGDA